MFTFGPEASFVSIALVINPDKARATEPLN